MERGDVTLLAQLLGAMNEVLGKMQEAQLKKNIEQFQRAKKEMLALADQVDALT